MKTMETYKHRNRFFPIYFDILKYIIYTVVVIEKERDKEMFIIGAIITALVFVPFYVKGMSKQEHFENKQAEALRRTRGKEIYKIAKESMESNSKFGF